MARKRSSSSFGPFSTSQDVAGDCDAAEGCVADRMHSLSAVDDPGSQRRLRDEIGPRRESLANKVGAKNSSDLPLYHLGGCGRCLVLITFGYLTENSRRIQDVPHAAFGAKPSRGGAEISPQVSFPKLL